MDALRWERAKNLFNDALELDSEEVEEFLDTSCAGDTDLRVEIEVLLAGYQKADNFMETSAVKDAIQVVKEEQERSAAAGSVMGNYRIIRQIGHGGMGAVFLADRTGEDYQKQVAIKLIRAGLTDELLLQRFVSERQILANLDHPNIARLIDGGATEDGAPYLVLEYVDGLPIDDYCDTHKLTTVERLKVFRIVCSAVQYAHQNLVVHRDLKPSNILVTVDGAPKLLDFGIAKLLHLDAAEMKEQTATVARIMTPQYASPEQVRGKNITTSSDIYSLGVLLYRLLTGHHPYQFKSMFPAEIDRVICEEDPDKPSTVIGRVEETPKTEGALTSRITIDIVSEARSEPPDGLRRRLKGDLDNIVLMAMRKEPERRYSSVEQFSEDIQRHLEGLPVVAANDTFTYRSGKFVRRNRLGVAAAALILATLLTGIGMTVREKRKADLRFSDVRHLANSFMFEVNDEIEKGPTKARATLVNRALEYLDRLAQEARSDPGLELELAAGYIKVGDTQGKPYRPNLGDTAGALASYRQAQTLLETLIAAAPNNLEARRHLSLAYQNVGRVQGRDGDWDAALESQRKALALSEALLAADPANGQFRALHADNYLHLGEALYQPERGATVDDDRQAIDYFRKALAIHEQLAAEDPTNGEYRWAAGVDYEYTGIVFNAIGDSTGDLGSHRAALANHRKELEINETLAASDPANATYRRSVADAYGEVARSQLKLGATPDALENFLHQLNIFESFRTADPTNVEAQRDLANACAKVGEAWAQTGAPITALAYERKAMEIYEGLSQREPVNTETRRGLLEAYDNIGESLVRIGDFGGALESHRKGLALLESWAGAEPDDVHVRRLLAMEDASLGRVYAHAAAGSKSSRTKQQTDLRAAQEWYRRSLNAWTELQAQGRLNEVDAKTVVELTSEVARCAATLTQH